MDTIASFTVDHTKIIPGVYISRIDGDVITFDIRMKKPNGGEYLDYAVIHTIEHLAATYVRNSEYKNNILYFGPMGCRTGFYLLTQNLSCENALDLIKNTFKFISEYEGDIPGVSEIECGNYLEHNMSLAKDEAKQYVKKFNELKPENMQY